MEFSSATYNNVVLNDNSYSKPIIRTDEAIDTLINNTKEYITDKNKADNGEGRIDNSRIHGVIGRGVELGARQATAKVVTAGKFVMNLIEGENENENEETIVTVPSRPTPANTDNVPMGTGTLGGKPIGEYAEVKGNTEKKRGLQRQNESADALADVGFDVEMVENDDSIKGKDGSSNPDVLIDGELADIYSPGKGNFDTIKRKISSKSKKQASTVVLNLNDSSLTEEDIIPRIKGNKPSGLDRIIVIKDGVITEHNLKKGVDK